MATKEMQFTFEAVGGNNTTKKLFKIAPEKEPTVTVVRGQINKISIAVLVTHTDAMGPDPLDALTRDPLNLQKGWPFKTRYDFDWDVEVDGEVISILGNPRESAKVFNARKGVKTQLKAEAGSKYLAIHAQSTFADAGLRLDVPFVDGEGDIVNLGGFSMASDPVKFLCKERRALVAPLEVRSVGRKFNGSRTATRHSSQRRSSDRVTARYQSA